MNKLFTPTIGFVLIAGIGAANLLATILLSKIVERNAQVDPIVVEKVVLATPSASIDASPTVVKKAPVVVPTAVVTVTPTN